MANSKSAPNKRSQPQGSASTSQPSLSQVESAAVTGEDSAEKIREAAYYKWEAAGCPCSDGVEFWLQAESEMQGQSGSSADQRPAKPR